jgi:hypothetical protein
VPDFTTFKVLLDGPAPAPALGFDDYALAFADIIRHSAPQFAIGIFGDWGSGKTTLMRAIHRQLESDPDVSCVWFNAWRYEREEHLIVPLLDSLREELAKVAAAEPDPQRQEKARAAAAMIARAAKAIVAGVTLKASLPVVGVGLELDPAKVMDSWRDEQRPIEDPVSFYHASFRAMEKAVEDFTAGAGRRIVVFVDDLDRCLPLSALQVLESMKLFFDFEGFVFVVGLDQRVIERSIEVKYQTPLTDGKAPTVRADRGAESGQPLIGPPQRAGLAVSGADYIKKIFQVPFGLPRISTDDLWPFFVALVENSGLPPEQQHDLRTTVWPHLEYTTEGGSVNPREVKRLVNAYTLQMKLLSAKLPDEPNSSVVLALQTMAFRSDWRPLYELLTADSELFLSALRPLVDDPNATADFSLRREPLPQSFLRYLRGPAQALVRVPALDVYITSAEATRSSDTTLLEGQTGIARVRQLLTDLGASDSNLGERDAWSAANQALNRLPELLAHRQGSPLFFEAMRTLDTIQRVLKETQAPPDVPSRQPAWAREVLEQLDGLDEALRAMRRETGVGSTSA